MIKSSRFSKCGQYVVFGKNIPRSVGLNLKSSAIKYAEYYKEKGLKPGITLVKDLKKKPAFFKFKNPNKTLRGLNKLIR